MTSARLAVRASILAVLALGGCSNGGAYDSGVDDSRPFDMLTDAEARTACENLLAYLRRNIPESRDLELGCTVDALQATATPEDCRASVSACLAGTPEPFLGFELDCASAAAASSCSSTVGEVEQCIGADLEQLFGRLDQVRCDIAGDIDALTALQTEPPTPMECSALGTECPDLADGFTD